ncbi:MAG: response regulator transcription factor [Bacteroidia bacterium]
MKALTKNPHDVSAVFLQSSAPAMHASISNHLAASMLYIMLESDGIQHADMVLLCLEKDIPAPENQVARVKSLNPDCQILVLGPAPSRKELLACLRAGASGFIDAWPDSQTLLQALDKLRQGGAPLSLAAARTLVTSFQPSKESPLSLRETEVLSLLSKGKTYSLIARELFVSGETVRSHIRNIYKKLHVRSKAEAIAKARQQQLLGYVPQYAGRPEGRMVA